MEFSWLHNNAVHLWFGRNKDLKFRVKEFFYLIILKVVVQIRGSAWIHLVLSREKVNTHLSHCLGDAGRHIYALHQAWLRNRIGIHKKRLPQKKKKKEYSHIKSWPWFHFWLCLQLYFPKIWISFILENIVEHALLYLAREERTFSLLWNNASSSRSILG